MKNSLLDFGSAFIDGLHPKNMLNSMILRLISYKYQ